MLKRALYLSAMAVAMFLVTGLVAKDEAKVELSKDCKCPVSGKAASADHALTHHGKHVYFCCENCPAAFKEDMKKFAALAHHQMLLTGEMVQVGCPMSGGPLDAEQSVEVAGLKVGFCCKECQAHAKESSAEEQVKMLFTSLKTKEGKDIFTLQTKCPLSGEKIDPSKHATHEGKNVYFCCEKCQAGFEKDPAKYVKDLPQFAKDEDAEHEGHDHDHDHDHDHKEEAKK